MSQPELKMKFVKLHEAGPAIPPVWIWEGYLAKGRTTTISGYAKTGKSTLLSYLLRQMHKGGELITDIAPAKVLVVSEENIEEWKERRDRLALGPHITYLDSRFGFKLDTQSWERLIRKVGAYCCLEGIDLVVFDTFVGVCPAKEENSSAEIMAALAPLHLLKRENGGISVLLIHHAGKGDGKRGQLGRGSSAFQGDTDINLEWTFYKHNQDWKDRKRVLAGNGRVASQIDSEIVLELDEDREGYTVLGSAAELSTRGLMEAVESILMAAGSKPASKEKIAAMLSYKPASRKLDAVLKDGLGEKRWIRSGEGRRGSPFMYRMRTT